jgi:hypothetical protein
MSQQDPKWINCNTHLPSSLVDKSNEKGASSGSAVFRSCKLACIALSKSLVGDTVVIAHEGSGSRLDGPNVGSLFSVRSITSECTEDSPRSPVKNASIAFCTSPLCFSVGLKTSSVYSEWKQN